MSTVVVGAGLGIQPHLIALRATGVTSVELVTTRQAARDRVRAVIPGGRNHDTLTDAIEAALAQAGTERPFAVVATPPSLHREHVAELAKAGFDVLIEKPIAHTLADTLATAACAEEHGARVFVCLQHRYKESAVEARALLADGALGKILGGSVAVPWYRAQEYYDEPGRGTVERDGGGVVITQAIHVIDVFTYLMPAATTVAAATITAAHDMPTEDLAGAVVTHRGGAISTIHATTATRPAAPETVEIWGTGGRLRVEGTALYVTTAREPEERCLVEPTPVSTGADPTEMAPWYVDMYVDIARARRAGTPTPVDISEVMPTHRLVHGFYAAAAGQHWAMVEEQR